MPILRFALNALGLAILVFYLYFCSLVVYCAVTDNPSVTFNADVPWTISWVIIIFAGVTPGWRKFWCRPL